MIGPRVWILITNKLIITCVWPIQGRLPSDVDPIELLRHTKLMYNLNYQR